MEDWLSCCNVLFCLLFLTELKFSHYYHMTLLNIRMANVLSAIYIYVAKTKVLISCTASLFSDMQKKNVFS